MTARQDMRHPRSFFCFTGGGGGPCWYCICSKPPISQFALHICPWGQRLDVRAAAAGSLEAGHICCRIVSQVHWLAGMRLVAFLPIALTLAAAGTIEVDTGEDLLPDSTGLRTFLRRFLPRRFYGAGQSANAPSGTYKRPGTNLGVGVL
jgi:hypothetical protein